MKGDRYNPGETVVVRQWDDMAAEYGTQSGSIKCPYNFIQAMRFLCGREFTVESCEDDTWCGQDIVRVYLVETGGFSFSADMFESPDDVGSDFDGSTGLLEILLGS